MYTVLLERYAYTRYIKESNIPSYSTILNKFLLATVKKSTSLSCSAGYTQLYLKLEK